MRFATISIIVITFIIYMGEIKDGKVLAIPIATTIDPIAPISPIDAIKKGVKLSKEVMKTLKDAIESSSIMKEIDAEIRRINLVNDYLTENERRMVTDAQVQLAVAENEFTILRIELSGFAELTKKTTTKLIKFTKRLVDDNSPKFNQQFKVIFKRFITLMNVQSKKLKEAKDRYEKMSAKLVETKVNLGAFKKGVEILENKETKRHDEYAKKVRWWTYGAFNALCKVGGAIIYWNENTKPLTCQYLIDPVVEAIVETRLDVYQKELNALKKKLETIYGSVTGMVEAITAKNEELKKELDLVIKWESLVVEAKETYGTTPITETIEDILPLKELAIDDFQDLYNAADAFNKWILKTA